jgi:hypothetical protein
MVQYLLYVVQVLVLEIQVIFFFTINFVKNLESFLIFSNNVDENIAKIK